jgi:hypothetical protein
LKTRIVPITAAALMLAACGGSPVDGQDPLPGSATSTGAVGASDPAAAWVGTYEGKMTLVHGAFTYTLPVRVAVGNPSRGIVRVPVLEMCPSVDHVDFAPPEALVIVLSEPGAWSFQLPTGEKVRLGSIQPRFGADGKTLTVTFHGVVDGVDLEWNFVGTR